MSGEKLARRRWVASVGGLGAAALVPSQARAQLACRAGESDAPRALSGDATGVDRTHLAILSLPARPRIGRAFDLVVRVGDPMHEQRRAHHLAWIEVRYGAERLFVVELSPDVPFPVVRVPVVLRRSDVLTVRVQCSRDGAFVSSLALEPT